MVNLYSNLSSLALGTMLLTLDYVASQKLILITKVSIYKSRPLLIKVQNWSTLHLQRHKREV